MILVLGIICFINCALNLYCIFLVDRLETRGFDYLWSKSEPIIEEVDYEKNC